MTRSVQVIWAFLTTWRLAISSLIWLVKLNNSSNYKMTWYEWSTAVSAAHQLTCNHVLSTLSFDVSFVVSLEAADLCKIQIYFCLSIQISFIWTKLIVFSIFSPILSNSKLIIDPIANPMMRHCTALGHRLESRGEAGSWWNHFHFLGAWIVI